jgi:hypothetical protein
MAQPFSQFEPFRGSIPHRNPGGATVAQRRRADLRRRALFIPQIEKLKASAASVLID